jgi:hypothetical protein
MAEPVPSDDSANGSISTLLEHDRRRLLAAVVDPFITEGYRNTSVEGICRATRRPPAHWPAVRRHPRLARSNARPRRTRERASEISGCDGRERARAEHAGGIVLQAFDLIASEARAEVAAAIPAHAPWPDQLATALKVVLELIDANPAPSRLVLVQAARATDSILRHYFALIESLAPFFAEGRRYADHRVPDLLGSTLTGGAAYMLGTHLAAERPAPVSTLFPELVRLLALPYLEEEEEIAELTASHRLPSATRPG